MTDDAPRALRALRDVEIAAESPAAEAERRRKVVARLDRLADSGRGRSQISQRAHRTQLVAAMALAAAIALFVLGTWRGGQSPSQATSNSEVAQVLSREGSVKLTRHDAGASIGDAALAPLDELSTGPASSAAVKTSTGAQVSVQESARVRLLPTAEGAEGERVEVVQGGAEFSVPKLGKQRAFAVVTRDTTVVVHGTRFTVTVVPGADADSSTTRVSVAEGLVEVRHHGEVRMLNPGQAWSSVPGDHEGGEALKSEVLEKPPTAVERPSERSGHERPSKGDGLTRVNDLYAAAMAAKAAGDDEGAVTLLEALLSRYPASALAPNARVERFRALKRLGKDTAAAHAAGEHLKRSRDGFAREEANETRKNGSR